METLEFILIRKYFTENYTIGRLSAEQNFLCNTLEDKVRDLQDLNHDGDFIDPGEGKVYGRTAIPYGRYRIIMVWFARHKKMTPMLLDVPGFTGIFMHAGKDENWTEGCILVGENKIKGHLINSEYWETTISKMIDDAIQMGKFVYITIKS
jgi:hypothetical protein